MALDYDFYVGALGWNTYITRETPLERATAQFRKDQFDSTPTVGDQSLAGWWTRGQLSFHRGAGVKYYELLGDSDDSVQNRFKGSLGINPWTAGEVELANSFTDIDLTNILDVVPASTGIAALKSGGSVQLVASALGATLTSYTDEGAVSIASDGAEIFACTPSAVEKQGAVTRYQYVTNPDFNPAGDTSFLTAVGAAASLAFAGSGQFSFTTAADTDGVEADVATAQTMPLRTNLLSNPSFETNVTGWAGVNSTISRASDGDEGGACLQMRSTAAGPTAMAAATPTGASGISVTVGETYALAASLRVGTTLAAKDAGCFLQIEWFNGATSLSQVDVTSSLSVAADTWVRLSGTAVAPASATHASVRLTVGGGGGSLTIDDSAIADRVIFEHATSVGNYFDGSTVADSSYTYAWSGVPHASTSVANPILSAAEFPVLVRFTPSRSLLIQEWNGTTWVDVSTAPANQRAAFYPTSGTDSLVKFRLMGVTGDVGATTVTDLSVTSSLAESASPNAVDDVRWAWTGTTNSSIQSRAVEAGHFSALWVPPSGTAWAGCWYVKNRLLALDTTGRWYALSPTSGGVVATADSFWNSGHASGWTLAEGPSAVYFARLNEIFSLTLTDDGLLPSVTAAKVAAQLPYGETIASIYAYLGQLLICTSSGVRTALIGDSGELAYGSRFIRGDFSRCGRIAAKGDLAYVTGTAEDDDGPSVFMVNLTESVTDLVPAYAELVSMDDDPYGGCLGADGLVYLFDDTGLLREASTIGTTGYLTTGFHRLGTLDPKVFRYVRVKTEGTVGSVTVSVLTPDGLEHAVGSVSAGDTDELDLGAVVGLPGSLEYLAIKFTLAGDGADGPTLLGYQLKALPLPKRQRMIRVPLMLFDKEENRHGQQMATDAWDRLAALEALEASNALVAFEDKETGETGSAYIESIEVRRVAPAARSEGFGGLVYLTLRKV